MSTPKNHHYVSQCHQKEFFNKNYGKIFIYNKENDFHYSKKSTKRLFSENHLNTREKKGNYDQTTLETELKILFEDQFPAHVKQVEKFLTYTYEKHKSYESLCWLTLLGILGEIRHPYFKEDIDEVMLDIESDFMLGYYKLSKKSIKQLLKTKEKSKYSNPLSYVNIALKILKKLEPLDFLIISIESNDHFILPDTSCFQVRGQLWNYSNPFISEIIQIGIPVTDKLFVLATPQLLKSGEHGIIYEKNNNSELISNINKNLLCFAKKAVACKSQNYLKNLVNKHKN